jgi:hypothetical protein
VLAKLVLTIGTATAAVFVLRPALNRAAAQVLQVPLPDLPRAEISQAGGGRDPGGLQALGRPDKAPLHRKDRMMTTNVGTTSALADPGARQAPRPSAPTS